MPPGAPPRASDDAAAAPGAGRGRRSQALALLAAAAAFALAYVVLHDDRGFLSRAVVLLLASAGAGATYVALFVVPRRAGPGAEEPAPERSHAPVPGDPEIVGDLPPESAPSARGYGPSDRDPR